MLNGSLKSKFNSNVVLEDALYLQNQPGTYLTNNGTKNLPDSKDYGFLCIVYGSEEKWRLCIFFPMTIDGIYINIYNGYGGVGWTGWKKIS